MTDSRRPSVLMVFPWCLDRIGHGNIQRVLAMADYLSSAGIDLDVVYQGNPNVPSREAELTAFRRVIRVDAWRSSDDARTSKEVEAFYGGYEPAPANFGPGTALTGVVRGLLDAIDYTAVIASYAWTAPIYEPLAHRALRIVDLHDVISLHGSRCEQATGTASPYTMALETEQFLWRKWDVVLAITADEGRVVAPQLRPTQRLLTVPHAVQSCRPDLTPSLKLRRTGQVGSLTRSEDVVYTGSDNPSNRASVSWLLSDVWPDVIRKRPEARLRLVGLIADAIRSTPLAATPGLDLVGFVERPAEETSRAAIVVAPYLYGSGLKLKVIEAAAAGRPVVTTSNGLEGTGLTHGHDVLVADVAAAFADAIVGLLDDPDARRRLGNAARAHAGRTFTPAACYQPLVDVIRTRAAEAVQPGIIPSSVEERLRTAIAALDRPAVVVWGNGSHTRSLLEVLRRLDAVPRCIVDKSASTAGSSPEGVAVVPAAAFVGSEGDLIVLSSQTFEAEMWRDVSAVAGSASAIGLYRRELVTPDLARRMRTANRREAPVATAPVSGGRLVIVEPSAGKTGGHFYRPARALQAAAQAAGSRVVLAGSRRIALDGLDLEDRLLLEPAFEFCHWDTLASLPDDRWRGLSRFGRMFGSDLVKLSSRLTLGSDDVVMFAMGNLVELLGAVEWARAAGGHQLPEMRILFHFLPEQEAQWLKITEAEVRHAYQVALGMLDDLAGDRVRLLAQSSALADGIADALGRRVDPVGFPVPLRLQRRASAGTGQPYRVLYAGEARADKGFGLLPALADALSSELDSGTVRLVCQTKLNGFADQALKDAARVLGARPGIEIIDRYLPSDGYDDLIAGCDLALLPYDPEQYRARLSAVFVDATCAGIPVVVPDGTWMSAQLACGHGAGEVFGPLALDRLVAATRRALSRLPELKGDAHQRAAQACASHDARAVLATIMSRVAVAA